jgi:2-polyprenyl-3-methyl-5-hydroxy-6-metoxy-1,4-benzoquinol methylase
MSLRAPRHKAKAATDSESPSLSPPEANRLFYASEAERYDQTEYCVRSPEAGERLRGVLQLATATLAPDANVLDAGGGSGNAASLLVRWGFNPVVVDVSPEMLSIWERKAQVLGVAPRAERAALDEFFATDDRRWDLVVFSSVLHHLPDPVETLKAAVQRLSPNGQIVTIFDPRKAARTGKVLRQLDYLLWMVRHDLGRVFTVGRRHIRTRRAVGDTSERLGELAELHAVTGLDDDAISEEMRKAGCQVVLHARYYQARHRAIRAIGRISRTPTGFAFVFRCPPAALREPQIERTPESAGLPTPRSLLSR